MTHRIGIIGLGTIGQRLLANVEKHDGFDIAAGWDPASEARAEVAAGWPDVRVGASADDVIGNDDNDVIYIGCPPDYHRGYVEAAVAAGKAVLCEKPLAIDLDDCAAMTDLVEKSDTKAAVNFVHASSAAVDTMEAAVKAGELGKLVRVDLRIQFRRWPRDWQARADWLRLRAQGGFVREVVSHFVYLTERLFGPAELIDAITGYPEDPALCETHALAQLDCDGLPVTVAAASGGVGPDLVEYTVWGERGSLRLNDWFNLYANDGDAWEPRLPGLTDPRGAAMQHQLDNLAALLAGRPHTMATFAAAQSVQRLIETMLSDTGADAA